ncbi:MAG: carboxypeptidase-like regulatory domain-containing protein [Flavobacteriales bacterium]|nr:carboxypeptidase-like regulatory domain-containing protein [Flavobacteriales bacterium]
MRALLVLLMLPVGWAAIAQELLRGRVVDANDGSPLPYATVLVHSTDRGTSTNSEGRVRRTEPARR